MYTKSVMRYPNATTFYVIETTPVFIYRVHSTRFIIENIAQ